MGAMLTGRRGEAQRGEIGGGGSVAVVGRHRALQFGRRQRGQGEYAQQIAQLFDVNARKLGLDRPMPELSGAAFRAPARDGQLRLL